MHIFDFIRKMTPDLPAGDGGGAGGAGAGGAGGGAGPDRKVIDGLTDKGVQGGSEFINLDKPLQIDGKLYTPAQIREMQTAAAGAGEARALEADLALIYDPNNTDVVKARAAQARVLRRSGWKDDEKINAELERIYGSPDAGGGKAEGEEDPATQDLKTLKDINSQSIDLHIETVVTGGMAGGELGKLVEGLKKRDGDKADAAIKTTQEMLDRELRVMLRSKMTEVGTFKLAWIREMMPLAAKAVFERVSKFTGDPKTLGRSQESIGSPYDGVLERKAVPSPKFTPEKSIGTLDKEISDDITDGLLRSAASSALSRTAAGASVA